MIHSFNGSYPITNPFGTYDPVAYANYPGSKHPGTDWGMPVGTQLVAGLTGHVAIYDRDPSVQVGRGKEVVITDGNVQRKTCHMSRIDVIPGQYVTEGQPIGRSGNTGYSSGPHLHDELLVLGVYMDVTHYIKEEDMPSTVGEVEFNDLFTAFFGPITEKNPVLEKDRKNWVGKETNTVIRAMKEDDRHLAFLNGKLDGVTQDELALIEVLKRVTKG